jgi:hypothetical protein
MVNLYTLTGKMANNAYIKMFTIFISVRGFIFQGEINDESTAHQSRKESSPQTLHGTCPCQNPCSQTGKEAEIGLWRQP